MDDFALAKMIVNDPVLKVMSFQLSKTYKRTMYSNFCLIKVLSLYQLKFSYFHHD